MGKYMRKTKVPNDVLSVMDATPTVTNAAAAAASGVRTRARASALQRLHASNSCELSPVSPVRSSSVYTSSLCYLQLRSRRLHKPALITAVAKEKSTKTVPKQEKKKQESRQKDGREEFEMKKDICEAEQLSTDHNCLDSEQQPDSMFSKGNSPKCQLSRNSNTIGTPSYTTRNACSTSANLSLCHDVRTDIALQMEMEEFFALAEQQQQSIFVKKYNFDVVSEMPLPGRYEWVQVIP